PAACPPHTRPRPPYRLRHLRQHLRVLSSRDSSQQNFQHPAPQLPVRLHRFVGRNRNLAAFLGPLLPQARPLHPQLALFQADRPLLPTMPADGPAFLPRVRRPRHPLRRQPYTASIVARPTTSISSS